MTKYKIHFLTLFSIFLFIPIFLFAFKVQGAPKPQTTISPFLQNVTIDGNKPSKFDIKYTNNSDKIQKLDLSVSDFGSLDDTGGVAFIGQEFSTLLDKYTLSKWLKLSAETLTLKPNQTKSITVTVVNDRTMAPGGHYGAVLAKPQSSSASGNVTVNLKQKISTLIFATKTGGEIYDLKLEKIESNSKLFKRPTEVYLTIQATGNVHVVPRGVVSLKDSSGRIVARGVINQESGYVLPSSDRIFTVQLNKVSKTKFWNTKYTIQVDYRYDGLDKFASKSRSIVYISYWWLLLLLSSIAIIHRRKHLYEFIKYIFKLVKIKLKK